MTYAVLSDIHGNLEALQAVVAGIASAHDFNSVALAVARRQRNMLSPAEPARMRALPRSRS